MAQEQLEDQQQSADDNEDPNANAAEGGDDQQQDSGEDSPYAPLAKDMGWVPRDQYEGPAESWKDPETFIRDGRDIQRETSRELKSVRAQLDTIAKTSASIVEQQVKESVDQLTAKYTKAVEDGDPKEAFRLSREIDTTLASAQPTTTRGPSPDAQGFAERNASWFNKPGNEYATARAIEITNMLASQGYDQPTQLRIAEQRLRTEMPQLFGKGMNGKPAPGVNAPGSRGSGPSNRQKGFSDMPKAAQDIAIDMAERDVFKTGDVQKSKELYARNYFANLEAKG